MQDVIKLGFVGCGTIATSHLKSLASMNEVKVVAFCDVNPNAAEQMAAKFDGQGFTDPNTMMDKAALDGVYICLPPFAHGAAEYAAIEHELPLFVEKPVGLEIAQMREIAQRIEKAGLISGAGYMNRYRQSVQMAREYLQHDPVLVGHGGWITRPPSASTPSWWVSKKRSGGQVHEQVTHTLDLIRYLAGEIVEVFAFGLRGRNAAGIPQLTGYDIEDATIINLKLADGGVVAVYSACVAGAGGAISLSLYAGMRTLLFTGWEHNCTFFNAGDAQEVKIAGEPDIFAIEDRAFIDAVKSGNQSGIRCTYAEGVRTALISLAVNESLETGQAVRSETYP